MTLYCYIKKWLLHSPWISCVEVLLQSFVIEGKFTYNYLIFTLVFFYLCRKPADLQNLAPGTHPPFITFNGEVKTDVNKIEEYLEDILCPPKLVNKKALVYLSFMCLSTSCQMVIFDLYLMCMFNQVL